MIPAVDGAGRIWGLVIIYSQVKLAKDKWHHSNYKLLITVNN